MTSGSGRGGREGGSNAAGDSGLYRRDFVRVLGGAAFAGAAPAGAAGLQTAARRLQPTADWPTLRVYDHEHLARIALPLGGIGTGTVSLGGRGDLRDWEMMNRPAKGFVPSSGDVWPFFALHARAGAQAPVCRILEGPLETWEYEGSHGSAVPNDNLPRFRDCAFGAAYPLGRIALSDPGVPLDVELRAFNPLIPADPDSSGLPIAVLTWILTNNTKQSVTASVCASMPNFIGIDGSASRADWKGDPVPSGASSNRNRYRESGPARGIFMTSDGVDPTSPAWGTIALAAISPAETSHRTNWKRNEWGVPILDFWDDFAADGMLDERTEGEKDVPVASLAVRVQIPAGSSREVRFVLAWRFPNRQTWTPSKDAPQSNTIGNHYCTRFRDAWEVVEHTVPRLADLEKRTLSFVRAFCDSDLPPEVKEAALFNLSTLRSQTCFRTADGRFFGWEGSSSRAGCCHGSCTHVWNYEQVTPFLFGELAMSMREVEFAHATRDDGMMSFRVHLPLTRAQEFGKAAADGQMGCILKMYRDWQLSGDDTRLRALWPRVRKAVEFCWIRGGWDADRDGVMEGCQHNTMDVEYYGPNPQMGIWYLGALRAAEEMARQVGETDFASTCRKLFEGGSRWLDGNLFNGEYYEHRVQPPGDRSQVAPSLLVGMGARDVTKPDYQLGRGCLVDQLVGQFVSHVCGLGYLVDREHVRTTLASIMKYNFRESLQSHFNCMRSFAIDGESALLMASYPKERPANPFPYFTEVMTGFEYAAAVGMLYEGMREEGLRCIRAIRARYDGRKRSPFDEAECGHHYARAMASWAAVLALTGFRYSAVTREMRFLPIEGTHFWANGYAWGTCRIRPSGGDFDVTLESLGGIVKLDRFLLTAHGAAEPGAVTDLRPGTPVRFRVKRD